MKALRVALLGASGIGRSHVRWFHGHGCDIVGFLGSTADSVALAGRVLQADLAIAPPGYTDLELLLAEARPDAVCIANPPPLHAAQVRRCLAAGAHVLCEKPLVGDSSQAHEVVVEEAYALAELARTSGLLLGTQMQYATAADRILQLSRAQLPLTNWSAVMETKTIRVGGGHERLWIDLSPHPLSVLQKLGAIAVHFDDARCEVEADETRSRFNVKFANQEQLCEADILVRCNRGSVPPQRRFTLNGKHVDYSAHKNAAGNYKAYLCGDAGREVEIPDLVDTLIGNFVAACCGEAELQVTGQDGAQNVEWQLGLLNARM